MADRLRRAAISVAVLLPWGWERAAAQDWLALGGVIALEGWATDSGSRLLMRNDGRPGGVVRVTAWAGVAPSSAVQILAIGELETGTARRDPGTAIGLQGATLRVAPARWLVVEAGRILSPIGAFGPRRLPTANPLIERPDTYPPSYPWGGQVSGASRFVDYRVAVVSLPVSDPRYISPPGHAPRIAAGMGLTPFIGVRLGASYTRGPYLAADTPLLPAGVDWKSREQEVMGFDARLSRGYFDFHGEFVLAMYQAPTNGLALEGTAAYAEVKYTWSPRLFTAVRLQRNEYPFIQVRNNRWLESVSTFVAGEVGLGVRLDRYTIVKASYQRDEWEQPATGRPLLNGQAFAIQLSRSFDVTEWVGKKRGG